MARPTCPACQNSRFEAVNFEPSGSKFKFVSVQCASCGAIVGVMDYTNIGAELGSLRKDVKRLSDAVEQTKSYVLDVHRLVQRRS
ncbi:hypothetical protein PSR1_00838 [Anaeromyxobacter sp. PSR-1]|nr:hypothetical protein PSR1_00838 [Anaeromyxobacter sp. PSR-1]